MAADYIDSYYRRSLGDDTRYPALAGAREVDVCVIGGGLAGLSTALELARRGRKVALLEQNRIGWGASGRNGGFVTSGFAVGLGHIERYVGRDEADALYRLSMEGVEIVRGNIAALGLPRADMVPGVLRVVRYPGAEGLKAHRDEMERRFGEKMQFLGRDEVQAMAASPRYHEGLYEDHSFHFHPLNYVRGIGAEIVRLGGEIFEATPARSVEQVGGKRIVAADGGRISAQHVVFCGGGYTDGIEKRLTRAFIPIVTYVLVTEKVGDLLERTIRTRAAIADDRRANDYYRVVDGDRILWGGRITTRTRDPHDLAAYLRREMVGTYPQLEKVKVELAWSGLMSYANHQMPQIGRLDEGLWHATAFGGHGMNTSSIAGRVMAEAITGESDRYRRFAPFGLPWAGGIFGSAAAQLTYWTYQALDAWRERGQ